MLAGNEDAFVGDNAGAGMGANRSALFGRVLSLVQHSSIQFVDLELSSAHISDIILRLIEDRFEDQHGIRSVLLPIEADNLGDGGVIHPLRLEPVKPERILSLNGLDGLQPFLGTWVPLPFHRFKGRNSDGRPVLDNGPHNWARAFVCDPGSPLQDANNVKVVLAFDTVLADASRSDNKPYLEPLVDDAMHGSTFLLQHDAAKLGLFLGQNWVASWLAEACGSWRSREGLAAPVCELDHIARYLAFLKILGGHEQLPQIRFVDSLAAACRPVEIEVDLVIDVSDSSTVALLREVDPDDPQRLLGNIEILDVRELSNPGTVHNGPLPTEAEFENSPFGYASLSRRSGRLDAFCWPSLVRIGREARRLSLRSSSVPGMTGLGHLKAHLSEVSPSPTPWRFGREVSDSNKLGPIVSGETLSQYQEDGRLLNGGLPALRPLFSKSAMLGLFLAELLLHALSQINAPGRPKQNKREGIRRLMRVVVTTAAATPADERTLLLERVTDAVEAVWRGLGWHEVTDGSRPQRPHIAFGLHADLGAQLVYLHEEIIEKFGGNVKDFVDVSRRQRANRAMIPALRIASVNIGSQHTNIAIVDYEGSRAGTLHPVRTHAERDAIAGDVVVAAIADQFVLGAIEATLNLQGTRGSKEIIEQAFSESATATNGSFLFSRHFAERMRHRILSPATTALLDAYIAFPAVAAGGLVSFDLSRLVAEGGGRLAPLDREFERVALNRGASQYCLASTRITINRRKFSSAVRSALAPLITSVARKIHLCECDILILSGRLAQLSDVDHSLLELLPLAPHRVINLASRGSKLVQIQHRPSSATAALMGAAGLYLNSRSVGLLPVPPQLDTLPAGSFASRRSTP